MGRTNKSRFSKDAEYGAASASDKYSLCRPAANLLSPTASSGAGADKRCGPAPGAPVRPRPVGRLKSSRWVGWSFQVRPAIPVVPWTAGRGSRGLLVSRREDESQRAHALALGTQDIRMPKQTRRHTAALLPAGCLGTSPSTTEVLEMPVLHPRAGTAGAPVGQVETHASSGDHGISFENQTRNRPERPLLSGLGHRSNI